MPGRRGASLTASLTLAELLIDRVVVADGDEECGRMNIDRSPRVPCVHADRVTRGCPMRNGSHGHRQVPLPPPSHDAHVIAHPMVEALKHRAELLRSRAGQAMAVGHWGVASWLEERAALTEHRAGLVTEELLALFWRN